MTYPTRPATDITDWATGASALVDAPPTERVLRGMRTGEPLPAGVFNLVARWAGMFAAINPEDSGLIGAGGVAGPILDYIRWRDPRAPTSYHLTWDQTGSGGELDAKLSSTSWTWNTGATQTTTWSVTGSTHTWTRGASSTGSMRLVAYPLSIAPVSSAWAGIKYESDGTTYPTATYDLTPGRGCAELWPPNQTWSLFTPSFPTAGGFGLIDVSGSPIVGTETIRYRVPLPAMPFYTDSAGYSLRALSFSVSFSWTAVGAVPANHLVTVTLMRPGDTAIATGTISGTSGAGTHTLDILSGSPHTVVEADATAYWVLVTVQASSSTDISVLLNSITATVWSEGIQ